MLSCSGTGTASDASSKDENTKSRRTLASNATGTNVGDMPLIGWGTYMIDKTDVAAALRQALALGYRRLDCAPVYFNEDAIGDALREVLHPATTMSQSNASAAVANKADDDDAPPNPRVQRSDLYIVSKLPSPFHRHVEAAVRKTLHDLRLDYLDLYLGAFTIRYKCHSLVSAALENADAPVLLLTSDCLCSISEIASFCFFGVLPTVHWPVAFYPVPNMEDMMQYRGWINDDIDNSDNGRNIDDSVSIHETWSGMEHVLRLGLVRQIGVCNMPVALLHELASRATVLLAVNQVELHPLLQQPNLLSYCRARGIHVQAYSPLGTPGYKEAHEPSVLDNDVLVRLAQRHAASPSQIALTWALQRGTSVVVKSVQALHLRDNLLTKATVDSSPFDADNNGQDRSGVIHLSNEEMKEIAALDRSYRFFRPQDWWGDNALAVFD
jgi:alcohol dehydrogenase (NADP+)